MKFKYKYLWVVLLFFTLTPGFSQALVLELQIFNLNDKDIAFKAELNEIKQLDTDGLINKLNEIIELAKIDLDASVSEKDSLKKHLSNLIELSEWMDEYQNIIQNSKNEEDIEELLENEVKNKAFTTNDSNCNISTNEEFKRFHHDFECNKEYVYALKIWKRSMLTERILLTWKSQDRANGLELIQESLIRWENFSNNVTSDQFPWETILNGKMIEGTISTPPTYQYRLVHPIAMLLYDNNNDRFNQELGFELGYRSYNEKDYKPEWGVSFITLLRSETSNHTGYGLTYSTNNFTFGVVRQETVDDNYDSSLIIGYNLAKLFENKENEFAKKKKNLTKKLKVKVEKHKNN